MQLTTLLLSLCVATTAFAAHLLTKRVMYNMDLEAIPDYPLDHDKYGNPIPPEDWPHYDSIDFLCEAHKNYVPRISMKMWKKECVHSMFPTKIQHTNPNSPFEFFFFLPFGCADMIDAMQQTEIFQWKVDHNVFESIFLAAEARDYEARRKQDEARKKQEVEVKKKRILEDCRKKPSKWCKIVVGPYAGMKKGGKKEEKEQGKEQGGDGVEVEA